MASLPRWLAIATAVVCGGPFPITQMACAHVSPAFQWVTCGSTLKIAHMETAARLHSHEVRYGTNGQSSGQNSITAIMSMTDANSHWKVLSPALATGRADECPSGSKIACGAALRLRHVKTGCLLHSHPQFLSPLSHNQEVSGVGCESSANLSGEEDLSDNWEVECTVAGAAFWRRDDLVRLRHQQTGRYLHHTGNHVYRRPIDGQKEICAVGLATKFSNWLAQEGAYVKADDSYVLKAPESSVSWLNNPGKSCQVFVEDPPVVRGFGAAAEACTHNRECKAVMCPAGSKLDCTLRAQDNLVSYAEEDCHTPFDDGGGVVSQYSDGTDHDEL